MSSLNSCAHLSSRFLLFLIICLLMSDDCSLSGKAKAYKNATAKEITAISAQAVQVVKEPTTDKTNSFYISNHPPLVPSPFAKLPIGSITPRGWLRYMLELDADGMTGHLPELSPWLKAEGNAWLSPNGEGSLHGSHWEAPVYWLRGYVNLGYVLKNERIINESRKWIEAILASQREDGYFGPRQNFRKNGKTNPDLWPNMLAMNVLEAFYEATGDERIIPFMLRYFRWQSKIPNEDFLLPFWQRMRACENLASIYWLYNRTSEDWLLELAKRTHAKGADWTSGIPNHYPYFGGWHGVNLAQSFKEPAVYYMQAKDSKFLQATGRNYETVKNLYGQVPGGMYGADEVAREGYTGPRQASETCAIVEFMHSCEMLGKITGNPVWADRCEEVAFNTFPAAQTPDHKALHYLTAPNLIQLDSDPKIPALSNGRCLLAYSPYEKYHCCQHNHGIGWPYYAQELWLATPDNGLCASLYASSEVQARVGDGTEVKVIEETKYPFDSTIRFTLSMPKRIQFPLYLRVPGWCQAATVTVNDKPVSVKPQPLSYIVVKRLWSNGDTVALNLPMTVKIKVWQKNKNSVSVNRGPLTYSLKIGEKWIRSGGTDKWPESEVYPTTPWNYGLVLDSQNAVSSFEVLKRPGLLPLQPFTPQATPIEMHAKARRISAWKVEGGLIGRLQMSPAKTSKPVETITLIPMGCARLRVSAFPTVGTGSDAYEWVEPPEVSASYCGLSHHSADTVYAVNDGILPRNSADTHWSWLSWSGHKGTMEWVNYKFDKPRSFSSAEVYWLDNTGHKQYAEWRVPTSWRIVWKDGQTWRPVKAPSEYGSKCDKSNKVTFQPVMTKEIRLEVQLKQNFSGGVHEWCVK